MMTIQTYENKKCIYSHVIWDFNGTILDDVGIGMDCANMLLLRRSLRPMSGKDEYRERFRFPVKEYYEELGFDFNTESYDVLAQEWVDLYNARSKEASLVPGVRMLMRELISRGVKQIVLSATEEKMLIGQLSDLRIYDLFDEVIGQSNIDAGGKIQSALEWRERTHPESMLLIGDTDHDYETAVAIGAQCVLVSSGHQSYARLKKSCPDAVIVKDIFEVADFIFRDVKNIF